MGSRQIAGELEIWLKKDGVAKTTPLLVSYSELAEEEKEYDRKVVLETLKLIIKLDYKIERRETRTL